MIDLSAIKAITIPEGIVKQITRGAELLWKGTTAAKFVGYTGTYSESAVEIDGAPHTLYTLTSSGTLTIEGDGALFWMCGGGAGGSRCRRSSEDGDRGGGGGGGGYTATGVLSAGEHVVVIGAGGVIHKNGNETSLGEVRALGGYCSGNDDKYGYGWTGGNGGSGGGGGCMAYYGSSGGVGAGVSTYPFGVVSLKAHSAGGAGGTAYVYYQYAYGGNGGTNGGNGGPGQAQHVDGTETAIGGEYGGGNASISYPTNAKFYGGGGAGASIANSGGGSATVGYQGVVYIAIPA